MKCSNATQRRRVQEQRVQEDSPPVDHDYRHIAWGGVCVCGASKASHTLTRTHTHTQGERE